MNRAAALSALQWHLDNGVDEALADEPINRLLQSPLSPPGRGQGEEDSAPLPAKNPPHPNPLPGGERGQQGVTPLGASEAKTEAVKLAAAANTLEDLRAAIASFDGVAIKSTATNLVFSDGNPKSAVMLIGEAPGADEDRMGKPFVEISGQLLDRILTCIDLDRMEEGDPNKSIYISNILNWRPPGNRTPSPSEVEVSLPFIEKHIALINPKILILCGGVSAKALLGKGESISKLRKSWRTYKTLTPGLGAELSIPCLATYHPAYLLRTPSQKKAVWEDMLNIEAKRRELGIL